jgi:hypothetical protein
MYNNGMRKEKTLFLIGLWVMILPFLGFPNNWRKALFFITGLALIYLAYLLYLETKKRLEKIGKQDKNFIDNIEDKKTNQTPEIRI